MKLICAKAFPLLIILIGRASNPPPFRFRADALRVMSRTWEGQSTEAILELPFLYPSLFHFCPFYTQFRELWNHQLSQCSRWLFHPLSERHHWLDQVFKTRMTASIKEKLNKSDDQTYEQIWSFNALIVQQHYSEKFCIKFLHYH